MTLSMCLCDWWEGGKKAEPLFSALPGDRTRGHKLKYKKFYIKIRKNVFVVRVDKDWPSLSRQAVEFQFWRYLELHGHAPGQPAVADPALSRGLDHQGLSASDIVWFSDRGQRQQLFLLSFQHYLFISKQFFSFPYNSKEQQFFKS